MTHRPPRVRHFFLVAFRDPVFLAAFRAPVFFAAFRAHVFFAGTLPPSRLASERPIAIACFRLVTFLPERPLFSVPSFRSCIAFSTFPDAFAPYFAMMLLPG